MYNITVPEEIEGARPVFKGVAVHAEVISTTLCKELWDEINALTHELIAATQADNIELQPVIAAIHETYKRCEEDPSCYRPLAEALRRRLMQGLGFYRIDTLMDLIDLVSFRTGYSIGGFDVDKIQGNSLELRIGRAEGPFEGIGRGVLNIKELSAYRGPTGGIGTPANGNECARMGLEAQYIPAIVNGYSGSDGLTEVVGMIQELLRKYIAPDSGIVLYFE